MTKDNTLLGELPTYKELLEGKLVHRCFVRPEECSSQCPTTYEKCGRYQEKLKAVSPKYKNE